MANYALLNEDNLVVNIITGRNEDEIIDGISDWEAYYGEFHNMTCVRTSRNTWLNKHAEGGTPFRKNYARIGYKYDGVGFFDPEKPHASWTFNEDTYAWEAPIPQPENTIDSFWVWNETDQQWENALDGFKPAIVSE